MRGRRTACVPFPPRVVPRGAAARAGRALLACCAHLEVLLAALCDKRDNGNPLNYQDADSHDS